MSTLKSLRMRKKSIQAAHKITSAMELVAASKSRRAQQHLQAARPYATLMSHMIHALISQIPHGASAPRLLQGTGHTEKHLLIVATSDRGLCGSFNGIIARFVRNLLSQYGRENQSFKLICVGQKGYDDLKRTYGSHIVATFKALDKPAFSDVVPLAHMIENLLNDGVFDVCTLVYNTFLTSFSQRLTTHRLIPYTPLPEEKKDPFSFGSETDFSIGPSAIYTYEPHARDVLDHLLPENLRVQLFRMLLENNASEQAARMTAMNSATRNAKKMMQTLDLIYNRTRQSLITRELIEIISGAEAL